MPNAQKCEVLIDLDRPRVLRYDLNALAELEEATGKTIGELFGKEVSSYGIDKLRKILWAGLIADDPSLLRDPREGVRKVGRLIEEAPGADLKEKLLSISRKINEAFALAWGPGKGSDPQGPPESPAGT